MFCVSINSVQNQQFIFHNVLHGCTQNKLPVWQWKCDYLMKLCCPCTFDLLLNGILLGVMCILSFKAIVDFDVAVFSWVQIMELHKFWPEMSKVFHNMITEMSQFVVLINDKSWSSQNELHLERFGHWTYVSNFLISPTFDIPSGVNFKPQIVGILTKPWTRLHSVHRQFRTQFLSRWWTFCTQTFFTLHWTCAKVHVGQCHMCQSPFATSSTVHVNSHHLGQVFASESRGPEFE